MNLTCEKCSTVNRDIARYCKRCGATFFAESLKLEEIVGRQDIKATIQKIINVMTLKGQKARDGDSPDKMNLHAILFGNTGAGKSMIIRILCEVYCKYGATEKEGAKIINAVDYPEFSKNIKANINKIKGGTLVIDNVHKLVPPGYSGGQIIQLDKLLAEMDQSGLDPIVILAGLPQGFREYIKENPDAKRRFNYVFDLPDYNADEMREITVNEINRKGFTVSHDANEKLIKLFMHEVEEKGKSFSNGHLALKYVEEITNNYFSRISLVGTNDEIIVSDDINFDIPDEETIFLDTHQIRKSLSQVYCQEDNTKQIVDSLEVWHAQIHKTKPLTLFLVGTSGVGKTYTVELLAKVLEPLGYEFCYFAMTEFSQEHAVSNLIGSPKGYIGSEDEPKLFEALNRTKKLIILFDEIEKAHEKILKAMMQLMDKGFLSWSKGEGDFRECIICFTSNAQMQKMVGLKSKFLETNQSIEGPEFQDKIRGILVRAQVAAEVCGRINRFIVYNPLTPEAIIAITHQEVCKLARRYGLEVMLTAPEYLAEMAKKTAGSMYGARPVQNQVRSTIAKVILSIMKEEPDVKKIAIRKSSDGYEAFEVDDKFQTLSYREMIDGAEIEMKNIESS